MCSNLTPIVLLFLLTAAAQAGGPYGSVHAGQWSGGAYTDDITGAFTHCSAAVTYESGVSLSVGMAANKQRTLGINNPDSVLIPGEIIPVSLTFDGKEKLNVFGNALSSGYVTIPMPQDSPLFLQFRKASFMTAFVKVRFFIFAISSTSQLMDILSNCVERMNMGGISAAGDFSVP